MNNDQPELPVAPSGGQTTPANSGFAQATQAAADPALAIGPPAPAAAAQRARVGIPAPPPWTEEEVMWLLVAKARRKTYQWLSEVSSISYPSCS